MIRCPECGAMNRDGSRFCNDCGTPLQRTKIRCAKCGTMNAVGNIFCDRCNTRLVPEQGIVPPGKTAPDPEETLTGVKGISLPSRSVVAEGITAEDNDLPDWLLDLSDEDNVENGATEPAATQNELIPGELPDWLSGMMPEQANNTTTETTGLEEVELAPATLPDWLSDKAPAEVQGALATPEPATSISEDMPDWLSGALEPATTTSPPPTESPAAEDLPDWLTESEPAQPAAAAQAQAKPDTEKGTDSGELPDWFTEDAAESPATEAVADSSADWLSDASGSLAPAQDKAESGLPDWMLGATESPATEAVADSAADWLNDASGSPAPAQDEAESGLPDWMFGTEESTPAPAASEATDEPFMAWEDEDETEDEDDFYDTTPNLDDLPAWLVKNADKEPPRGAQGQPEIPSWLMSTADAEPPEVVTESQDLPQWLLATADEETEALAEDSIAEEEYAAEPAGAFNSTAEDAAPDWLSGLGEAATSTTEEEENVLPDWLAGVEESPAEPTPQAPVANTNEDIPDWLAGAMGDAEPITETPTAAEPAAAEEALPDWLAGAIETPAEQPTPQVTEPNANENIPDWLAGVMEDAQPAAEPATAEEALPDWLAGAVETPAEPTPQAPVANTNENIPDWLAGVMEDAQPAAEPAAEEEALPDWLAGAVEQPSTASEPAPVASAEEAVPDWLKSLDQPEADPQSAVFDSAEAPSTAEIPDWLADLTPTSAESEDTATAPPETAEAPEWLKEVTPAPDTISPTEAAPTFIADDAPSPEEQLESPAVEAEEIPDWLNQLDPGTAQPTSTAAEDDDLARANVPQWLQGLRPPGTGPLPPLPKAMGVNLDIPDTDDSGLTRAEIPDWVKLLRPAPGDDAAASAKPLGPAEAQGPLAGLYGIIASGETVDVPADAEKSKQSSIPKTIVDQAQLWQQLLEHPRSAERAVALKQDQFSATKVALRLILAALLIGITVFRLLWVGERFAQAPSHEGISGLRSSIESLQPGDSVILAVEYGPAEYSEMQLLTEEVLNHLADRDVEVMAVSSLVEGTGLIPGILASASLSNTLPGLQPQCYLSGSYNGIARFLSIDGVKNADMLLILSARANRVRWWIEQHNAAGLSIPIGFGVSAATNPLVSPYFDDENAAGALVGIRDAVAYREARGLTSDVYGRVLDALMFTHWVALAFLLFGLLYYWAAGKKKRTE